MNTSKNLNHSHLGKIFRATRVATPGMEPGRARTIIILLAMCTALQMIGFGMIFPLFARKIADFGGGMEVLAASLMAYSLAGIFAAPIMGTLADRYGRRPLLLGSLVVFMVAFSGYFLATSSWMFILIRAFAGGLTAGFWPATMGIVADIAPEKERARWIGIIDGGGSAGWIVGPLVGGLLFDKWGFGIPFMVAIVMNLIAFLTTLFFIPESHTEKERHRAVLHQKRITRLTPHTSATASFRASLPRPLLAFGILLLLNLSMIFAWFFIEPHLPFYVFDELELSTAQFGALVSFYGWA